ncbi:PREDICTED: pentatricopeptide repeat-containing protein At3g60960, mitochondrial-like [Camelina sativa]|uniref:Pentatricopeptide repeat-containing protein At3g60960, mitochondrial-like n=1 Tax=Camelina sativa TaxID=90675 RepID=A0ABM0SZZ5_CAMSA|nr:PREDICTED: pentatricopeptide repeat-containing protein At3g60960, mitochondrial-like [Camelina sativa]
MSLLRLRSALSLSSPIYQLRRQVSSLPLQNHTTPTSSATFPFPVPRDPSSPPLKLPTDIISKFDYTASHVFAKVKILIDLSNLDAAAEYARLAVLAVPKSPSDTRTKTETYRLIIGSMCREKRFEEAYELFHYFFNVNNVEPDVPCFGYVVYALINQGRLDEAFRFNRCYCPGSDTLMNALIDAGRIDEAYSLFFGGTTYPVFIRGFLAHGNIDKANKLFKDLKQVHETYPCYGAEYIEMSQVAYMEHFFKHGKDEEAMQWYRSTISKYCLKQGTVDNRIPKTWDNRADTVNTVLKVLLKYGKKTEAWSLFDKLCGNSDIERKEVGKWTDQETRCIMIRECFETGEISKAVEIARTKEAWDGNDECYTTLVTRFVREGMMSEADEMFNEMFSSVRFPMYRYLGIHRVMVDGFVKAGRFDDAHRFVNKIADISLNHVSRRVDFSLSTGHGFFI